MARPEELVLASRLVAGADSGRKSVYPAHNHVTFLQTLHLEVL